MYTIRATDTLPDLGTSNGWTGWDGAEVLAIDSFHPKSSSHRPRSTARVVHDGKHLFVGFEVADRFVRVVRTGYQENVCKDSCVEFFVAPREGHGYFNFEVNAGGAMLLHYNPPQVGDGPRQWEALGEEWAREVEIRASLPQRVEPEHAGPLTWQVRVRIPIALFEAVVGALGPISGQTWRGNFYKIASESSHPHWASWHPIGERLDFHQPDHFGHLYLA